MTHSCSVLVVQPEVLNIHTYIYIRVSYLKDNALKHAFTSFRLISHEKLCLKYCTFKASCGLLFPAFTKLH